MAAYEIVDAHQHFWHKELLAGKLPPEWSPLEQDFGPADLRPQLDQAGVARTVLVQTQSAIENTEDFLRIADEHPWVAGVVGWVDLTDPNIARTLDRVQRHPKLKGVRHQWEDEKDPAWILRPDVVRGLRELARVGLRYDLLAKPPNWPYITRVAEAVPDLPLVIDHIAKPNIRTRQFDSWRDMMRDAAAVPWMMCKVSGMVTEADWQSWTERDLQPYVDTAIDAFGPERVMFGSDWPVCVVAGSYGRVFEAMQACCAGLTEDDRAQVFGATARRFYNLD